MAERNTSDIATLLAEALGKSPQERPAFLARACGDNAALRRDIEDLLSANDKAGDFLKKAAVPTGVLPSGAVATMAPPPREDVGTRIGPYKILQLIGEGGFGSVYMAEQEQPVRRRVALKIIKLGMDTRQVIARFEAERQALAIMDHPNIAHVFDAGATDTGRPFFVMELVKGEPITVYCDRHRLSIEQRLNLFRQVCSAVQHAHQKGVIHRDLKPSNVLVTLHDSQPLPKVIDFGIAKATSSRLTERTLFTEFRQMIGTPEYMSPEQAEANATDVDTRADVYSLGVLLYELLTGVTPFDGHRLRSAAFGELQRIIREEDPPRPSTRLSTIESLPTIASQRAIEPAKLRTEVRGDLDWIVMRAIEKDRTRRYESASALADDIERHLQDQPVEAGPASAIYRARKFVRRHRLQVIATGMVALALIGGSIGTLVGMLRARDSASVARDEASKANAINDFMSEVLTSVDPNRKGADVRLLEVIDDASRDASTRFAGHLELEAQVRLLLAEVYTRLSESSKSQVELQKAIAIRTQQAGPDDRRTLAVQLRLADQFAGREETAQAEAMLKDIAPRVARSFSAEAPAAIEVQRLEGMIDMLRGRYDEAEKKFLSARDRLKAIGDDDGLQLQVLEGLIRVERRRVFASDDTESDDLATMEALVRESIDRATRHHGPEATQTLDARVRLAGVHWQQRRLHTAVATCRSILDLTYLKYPECSGMRDDASTILAYALSGLGQTTEPADLMLKRVECLRQRDAYKDADPVMLSAMADCLRFLERDGRGAEGEAMARKVAGALANVGGGHDDIAYPTNSYVAHFVSMQGRLDEAETLYAALVARETSNDVPVVRARLHLFLASHRLRQGRYEDAETELNKATTLRGDIRLGTMSTHPDDIILGYAQLYEAWNKPEKAQEYRRMQEQVMAPLD